MNKLYLSALEGISRRLGRVERDLDDAVRLLPVEAQPLVFEALAKIQGVRSKITRVNAAGVRKDPEHYLTDLLREWEAHDE